MNAEEAVLADYSSEERAAYARIQQHIHEGPLPCGRARRTGVCAAARPCCWWKHSTEINIVTLSYFCQVPCSVVLRLCKDERGGTRGVMWNFAVIFCGSQFFLHSLD